MPLKGIKVLEFVGLAPGPFCGKILSDFGASVVRIDKAIYNPLDSFQNSKRTLAVNIKNPKSQDLIKRLCQHYDVLIEPYRPGVMEKYNLGPMTLLKENPKLIYARLTGFGQKGPLASRAGHDINYVALSGVLSFLGRKNENPTPPINLLADFAGGGLLCAFGICLAILERYKSGRGQVVDNSMVEGCAYIGSWLMMSQNLPIWGKSRGENILDTGAFYYDTYETKDGKYMSVGALEPQFYKIFVEKLCLSELSQFDDNDEAKRKIKNAFLTKTQEEWTKIFEEVDACVFPVVEWQNVMKHNHNNYRNSFNQDGDTIIPRPAPLLERTPGYCRSNKNIDYYSDAINILNEIGLSKEEISSMVEDETIILQKNSKI